MPEKTVHFIRHGQSLHNATADPTGADPMIHDAPLTLLGHRQAMALQPQMNGLPSIELVVMSPLTRAIQTALHAFAHHPAKRLVMPTHREHLSNWCDVGRPPAELAATFPGLDFDDLPDPWWYVDAASKALYEREPEDHYAQRLAEFETWLHQRPEKHIAIVGHGNFLFRLTGHIYDNAEVLTVEFPVEEPVREMPQRGAIPA